MALSTTQYGYIIDPMVPFTDDKGKTIKNGFVRVFVAGSSTPVVTYRNFDGATNTDRIELDNSGRTMTSVIGSKGLTYKVCVYDKHHSQESPILTVDKVSVIGANITAGTGATLVTGLDGITTKPAGFVDASVIGTDGYVALDHTLVTDNLNTDAKVDAVENDRYIPLLNNDVDDPDSKMTLGRLWQWVLGKIKSLSTTITAFRTGDVIPVDGPSGTAKMAKDDLLRETAENALAGNVVPAFDSTIDYKQGEIVSHDGKTYVFDFDHSAGAFSSLDCTELCAEEITDRIKTFIPNFGVKPFLKRGWYWNSEEKRLVKANAADVAKYCNVCFYNVSAGEKVYLPNLGLTLTILLQKADKTSETISFSWDGSHFVGTSTGKGNIFAQYTSPGGAFTDLSMFTDTSVKRSGACIDASAVEGVVNSATSDIRSTLGAISQKAINDPVQFCKAGYWYNEVTKKLTYQNSFSYCTEVFENVVQGETIYVGNWAGTVTAYHLSKDGTTQTAMSLPTFKDGYWPFVMPADGTFYFRRYSADTSKFADLSIYTISDHRDGVFASLLDLKGLSSSTGKIVWVGTSIPAGAGYPEDIETALGYEVYNRAIGSSPLIGTNNKLALALSFAEKQALGICNASDTDAENASYENRLIPYIDGTTQKADAIVIDHGYNDTYQIYTWFKDKCIEKSLITQESDFDNGDGTYKDYLVDEIDGTWFDWQVGKTTWTAAEKNGDFISSFNFLVYTLRNTNPYLKIIVSSHLENKSCVLSQNTSWNGMCGKLVCKVQQILADHYGFYFMDVCNKTGWAKNIAMPNSSTFIATYNATYGTNYFSYWNDTNSNISVFQYFCPDGVHPQSDKSGNTRKYLSQIFIKSIDRFV